MRVLVVSNGYPPRGRFGTEFYTKELVRGLSNRGHELFVFHPVRDGSRPRYTVEEIEEEGVPVFLLYNEGDPRKAFEASYRDAAVERAFADVLERVRPDCVHFLYLVWGLSVGLPEVAHAAGIPSVLTLTDYTLLCHRGQMFDSGLARCGGPHPPEICADCIREPGPFDHPPLKRALVRVLAHGIAAVGGLGRVVTTPDLLAREKAVAKMFGAVSSFIAPTENLRAVFERCGVPRAKLSTLVYAFDELPYEAVRRAAKPHPARIGFFGQFAPHKGYGTLVRAFERLEAARGPDDLGVELVLYGTPSAGRHRMYAERVLSKVRSNKIRVGEAFEPDEAPEVLSRLTALVAPSEWDENAPLALLQARAAGVPIVASDVPGIAEIVTHGVHGRLFPPGDVLALSDALFAVICGEPERALDPGLPLSYDEHLKRIEELLGSVSTPARPRTD